MIQRYCVLVFRGERFLGAFNRHTGRADSFSYSHGVMKCAELLGCDDVTAYLWPVEEIAMRKERTEPDAAVVAANRLVCEDVA